MKNLKSINEFWGAVIRRDMSSAVREEDKFHNKKELREYLKKEIEKQGENVVIKDLDVSGIEDLKELFFCLLDDVETLDLSGWNTKGVKDMGGMFYWSNIKSLNLSGWDTSSVIDMHNMFHSCIDLKSLNLSGWSVSNVCDMEYMFYGCEELKSIDLSSWDTGNVKNMHGMFAGCKKLESLDLSSWDTGNVKNMYGMFYGCPASYKLVNGKIVRR